MSSWSDPELIKLFGKKTPLIDVRAPVEFEAGAIPYSINLPIMTNEERAAVGTTYKQEGQASAIELGHRLVNGKIRAERLLLWDDYLKRNPEAQVFCFRGGLRSQITCQWLREIGHEIYPLDGGYKRLRKFFISWLEDAPLPKLYRIGGLTGTGKTSFLKNFSNSLDLEALACHRGSAFGNHSPQPSQVTFENNLALSLLSSQGHKNIIVEDESATLGKITLPSRFFHALREAPLIVIRMSEQERVKNIFVDYVKESDAQFFIRGMFKIKKRLSNQYFEEMLKKITEAFEKGQTLEAHEEWISMLLKHYYDPLYEKDLNRNAHLVAFEGSAEEVKTYLRSLS